MNTKVKKPYVIYMAEIIYSYVSIEKNKDPELDVKQAINKFMETNEFIKLSTGALHDEWFSELKKNEYIDKDTGNKIPDETIKLLNVQKDATVKQLIKYPDLYYAKSSFPLEISQRAFDFLWRMCESYELWCKETGQSEQLLLKITD